jgi:Response regulator containing a CheY-like receiver domain and an HTH DNA-binding domain
MGEKLKFLVVDDHPIFRQGLIALLESESRYRVCAEAGTVEEALDAFESKKPDMVLLDISLGPRNGLELLHSFWTARPEVPVLVISIHDESVYAERALRAHARGYLMKQEASSVLKEAIATILAGKIFVSPAFRDRMLEGVSVAPRESASLAPLSDRELEVLERLGRGFGSKEISADIGISVKTVGVYLDHIKKKLGIESMAQLRKYAISWVQSS